LFPADLAAVSSGFNARLDFGELARKGRCCYGLKNKSKRSKHFAYFSLSLALLVLGVLANNANDAAAVDYLALVTDLLY
jgi:hypothetical protein